MKKNVLEDIAKKSQLEYRIGEHTTGESPSFGKWKTGAFSHVQRDKKGNIVLVVLDNLEISQYNFEMDEDDVWIFQIEDYLVEIKQH